MKKETLGSLRKDCDGAGISYSANDTKAALKAKLEAKEDKPIAEGLPGGPPTDQSPQSFDGIQIRKIVDESGRPGVNIITSGNVDATQIQFLCEAAIAVARQELGLPKLT